MRLYDITEAYRAIQEATYETGGELTAELEELIDSTDQELEEKLESMGRLIKNIQAEEDMIANERKQFEQEAKRLKEVEKQRADRVTSIKSYMSRCLIGADIQKIKTKTFSYWLKEDHSVEVEKTDGPPNVPAEMLTAKTTFTVDKKHLLSMWKNMEDNDSNREFGDARVVTKLSLYMR